MASFWQNSCKTMSLYISRLDIILSATFYQNNYKNKLFFLWSIREKVSTMLRTTFNESEINKYHIFDRKLPGIF